MVANKLKTSKNSDLVCRTHVAIKFRSKLCLTGKFHNVLVSLMSWASEKQLFNVLVSLMSWASEKQLIILTVFGKIQIRHSGHFRKKN